MATAHKIPRHQRESYRWYVLLTVFMGAFMAPLDSSIVNVAMPAMGRALSVDIQTVGWVAMAYLLTTSTLLLSAGRLGDIKGHKKIYIAGFVIFTAASALCGFAASITQLVIFRVLQAIGGTCMLATGPALLTDAFPSRERGKALGMVSVAVALGLTVGPFLGGMIVGSIGWRWIFFINLPVGIIAVTMAALFLSNKKRHPAGRFDIAGSSLAFISLFTLLLALSMGKSWGWGSISIVGLVVTAAASAALFVMAERKVEEPMLDLSLFRNRLFTAANITALVNYLSLFIAMFLMPFYLGDVFKASPQHIGVTLTAVPLASAAAAPFSGALSDRIGSRFLSSFGIAVSGLALFGLSFTSAGGGYAPVILLLGAIGLGSGIFQAPNTSAIMGSVSRSRLGIAAGLQATMRNIGMVLGIAIAGVTVGLLAPRGASDPGLSYAIHQAFLLGAAVSAVGVVTSLVRGGSDPQEEPVSIPAS